ncbi:MAG: DUF4294 domain-containing protein [Bacteroidetes bacterium]|nr:DUF4294 domain-containing protein [Bacteroidota bacterium]
MEIKESGVPRLSCDCRQSFNSYFVGFYMLKHFKYSCLFFLLFFFSFQKTSAQDSVKIGRYRLPAIIVGEDTIPVINLPLVTVADFADPMILKNVQAYYRLRFNVIKVYPYAKLAAVKLNEMNEYAATLSNAKEKKKYIKETEKQMKIDFEEQIKNLSISQGDVLIKLINRETGNTSYELIKELRGSLSAFFDQGVARLFGHNLKDTYEPEGKDKTIEDIVRQIESGQITF